MCSSGVWISIIPFARFTHERPRALKTFASAPPPLSAYVGSNPALRSARRGEDDGQIALAKAIAGKARTHLGLELALGEARGERGRLEHLAHEVIRLALVVRPHLGNELAPFRNDVPCGPARDHADARAGLLVDPSEPEVGDRTCRSGDRRATVLGAHPRMCRASVEAKVEQATVW